jgi:biotin carboxyl carrier protein
VPTRLNITLAAQESEPQQHQFELEAAIAGEQGGQVRCVVDGGDAALADWARIAPGIYSILVNGHSYDVHVRPPGGTASDYDVRVGSESFRVVVRDPRARQQPAGEGSTGPQEITAPMPGKIVKLLVREGDEIKADDGLLVMEAMKMQNELRAPRSGRVERVYAAEGLGVETGAPLIRLA